MHLNFRKFVGPNGVPMFVETMPGAKTVAINLVMFVGAADDLSVGTHGLHHWFEHVPFRGTKRYPGGSKDWLDLELRHGGSINAATSSIATRYDAHVKRELWREALAVLVDMVANPLLRTEDVEAERAIIKHEMTERKSDDGALAEEMGQRLFYGDHPLAGSVLGTDETLASMDVETLREAHRRGYSWNRAVFLVSGPLDGADVAAEIGRLIELSPLEEASERRRPASYGKLPLPPSGIQKISRDASSTYVSVSLPIPTAVTLREAVVWDVLGGMFAGGGTEGPLLNELREKRGLVYGASMTQGFSVDGSRFGCSMQTRSGSVEEVVSTLAGLWKSAVIRDADRLGLIKDCRLSAWAFASVTPGNSLRWAFSQMVELGSPVTIKDYERALCEVTLDEVADRLDHIPFEKATILVLEGRD